jgi:hypothetical protein
VTQTTMRTDLLQSFQIVTELGVDAVGEDLRIFAVDNVALSVEEPAGDLVLGWVLDDGDDSFELFGCEFTGAIRVLDFGIFDGCGVLGNGIPFVEVDIGLLADQVRVSATDTLDLGQGVHDLLLSYSNCQTTISNIIL